MVFEEYLCRGGNGPDCRLATLVRKLNATFAIVCKALLLRGLYKSLKKSIDIP